MFTCRFSGINASRRGLLTGVALGLATLAVAGARAADCEVTPAPAWKDSIDFPDDPFRATGGLSASNPGWVKFTILTCDPTRVYFQDSEAHAFHYEFASKFLDPFVGMSPQQFDQVTLHAAGQQAILGAVILPPVRAVTPQEYGIELIRRDAYDPQQVVDLFELVRSRVQAPPGTQAFYFPSFEQTSSAEAHREFLAARGIEIGSPGRWADGNACYSHGWALGTLREFAPGEIEDAYREGRLGPDDILLTDGVPRDLPFLQGIVSLAPSTPNSHVAILANNYAIPFVHLALPEDAGRARQLAGSRIILRAYTDREERCEVRLFDIEGVLDEATIAEILALKELPPLEIAPMTPRGSYSVPVEGLALADIRFVGGKAANYSLLRAAIPDHSRVAVAFTFDLWNAFLDQVLPGGKTLRQEIAARLAAHTSYPPPDLLALADDLGGIRDLFRDESVTVFSQELRNAVIDTLQDPQYGFDVRKKIRFRSSTNVEDSDLFTGAGLFDSRSGCLPDDLDGDDVGPSICDPTKAEERGVFRAIRRVFASFYNENAFLERLRWGVDEAEVGMAILVHHSFPDDIELANGVATVKKDGHFFHDVLLVSQVGAVSVSNPEDGSTPEEVETAYSLTTGTPRLVQSPEVLRPSNRVILGDTVLDWQDDYLALGLRLMAVVQAFEAATGLGRYALDFEYKKIAPGGELVIKQVRQIPLPDTTPGITPFLINEPVDYSVFHGEVNFGEVTDAGRAFASQRLKSHWTLETRNMWLTPENLAEGLYTRIELEYTDACEVYEFGGLPGDFPEATHTFDGSEVRDTWEFPDLSNPRTYELVTANVPTLVSPAESPILTQLDLGEPVDQYFGRAVRVEHASPVLSEEGYPPRKVWTTTEEVRIIPCPGLQPEDRLQTRLFEGKDGVSISTSFYWPGKEPGFGRKTDFLVEWSETRIQGLTTEPLVLGGDFSQTYVPQHHNFFEHFLFEPRLEPGLPPAALAELEERGVHLIHVFAGQGQLEITYHEAGDVGHVCGCRMFIRGDSNGDASLDISDGIHLLVYLFLGGPPPVILESGDADDDGSLQISDAIYLFTYLFLGGPEPAPPFPDPGCASAP